VPKNPLQKKEQFEKWLQMMFNIFCTLVIDGPEAVKDHQEEADRIKEAIETLL